MRVIAWYFLAVIIASCRLFQQQNDPLAARGAHVWRVECW